MDRYDLIVIGGGPAGITAALGAWEGGCRSILLLERSAWLGGVLPQCVHTGFGLYEYGRELTGPEYAACQIQRLKETGVEVWLEVTALSIGPEKQVTVMGAERGLRICTAGAVLLASGARERPAGALPITGTRPAGVFTAGQAQQMLNLSGYDIGHDVVILGSGDIGMIVARRLALEGRRVLGVVEQAARGGGLYRNRIQCLEEFHIPLWCSTTVTRLHGRARLGGVTLRSAGGEERLLPCDTLITSVGLLPERELLDGLGEVSPPWLFVCGNAEHIYDLVDRAAREAGRLGRAIAEWLKKGGSRPKTPRETAEKKSGETLPAGHILCLCCPSGCELSPDGRGGVSGAGCGRGADFYRQEQLERRRYLTLVLTVQGRRLPVRTDRPIPRAAFDGVILAAQKCSVSLPVRMGQMILKDPAGCGANLVAQCDCGPAQNDEISRDRAENAGLQG